MRRFASISLFATLAFAGISAGPAVAPAQAGVAQVKRVVIVDLQRVLLETSQGKKAKRELEQALKRGEAKLQRKAAALQKEVQDLQAKAAMLSPEVLQQRQMELMQSNQELERLYMEQSEKLQRKELQLTEKIHKNVSAIVGQMAREQDIQVVLVRSEATVLYANKALDITNKVIVAYDKKHPK